MTEGPLSQQERAALRDRVARLAHRPALAVVCLGELPAWVGEDCAACGLYCERYALPPGMGEAGLAELLAELSRRPGWPGLCATGEKYGRPHLGAGAGANAGTCRNDR